MHFPSHLGPVIALALSSLLLVACDSETSGTTPDSGGGLTMTGGGRAGGTGGTTALAQGGTGGKADPQGGAITLGGAPMGGATSGGNTTGGHAMDAGVRLDSTVTLDVKPLPGGMDSATQFDARSSDTMVSQDTGTTTDSAGEGAGGSPIKVWLAGDSTVASCASACPCGWGGAFDALFSTHVTVVNSAIGGRSIQTWLYDPNVSTTKDSDGECTLTSTVYSGRWNAILHPTTGMKAGDYLFIQFGINDGTSTCPRHVGSALYQKYLGMMAQAAKDRGAHPIFLTPAGAIACSGSTAVASRGFISETNTAGKAHSVPVIDLHQLSIDLYNRLKLCPNNGDYTTGAVGDFFCVDHTHFEAAGAAQIAKVIAKALQDQNIALASFLL